MVPSVDRRNGARLPYCYSGEDFPSSLQILVGAMGQALTSFVEIRAVAVAAHLLWLTVCLWWLLVVAVEMAIL